MNRSLDFSRDIYSVSRLNREARAVLEGGFPLLWVEGELSNLAQPASGHIYFSLKDPAAQVRCAMFRSKRLLLGFKPANHQQVLVRARVGLYEGRGDFQLIVEHMEPAGEGALRLAFERLKQKLAAEGLFDAATKQPLPAMPRQVGLITSPTGAAVRDLLTVLERRFPALPVLIYPAQVQGQSAAAELVAALDLANERAECDILILARGGGSLEDLQAFNDEALARAVHRSAIPVVTGIGHEIDLSIADLVADQRGATPSAAAELVAPPRNIWRSVYRPSNSDCAGRRDTGPCRGPATLRRRGETPASPASPGASPAPAATSRRPTTPPDHRHGKENSRCPETARPTRPADTRGIPTGQAGAPAADPRHPRTPVARGGGTESGRLRRTPRPRRSGPGGAQSPRHPDPRLRHPAPRADRASHHRRGPTGARGPGGRTPGPRRPDPRSRRGHWGPDS